MYSRRTEVKVVRRGESSGESAVYGEGVGAGGRFIAVVVDQKTSFPLGDHLTTIVSSFSCFELTEPEQSRLGFTVKFREEGMAQSGPRLNWFDLPRAGWAVPIFIAPPNTRSEPGHQ